MKKALLAAVAITFASSGAWGNSLTFQDITFTTANLGSGQLQLTITNALNASGNWQGINYLESFAIGNVGSFTSASLSGFTYNGGGLSNGSSTGCDGKGTGWACFKMGSSPLALSNNMVFDVAFAGTPDFSLPSLKVDFWTDSFQIQSTGDLLSQSIPVSATPLPASWTMMLSGLVLGFGFMVYQRAKQGGRAEVRAAA